MKHHLKHKTKWSLLLLLTVFTLLISSAMPVMAATRKSNSITASNMSIPLGTTKNLGAKGKTTLSYKSSNPSILGVDSKGNAKAKRAGTVTVTIYAKATSKYNSAKKNITVTVYKRQANSITYSNISVNAKESKNLKAKGKTSLTYTSSNAKVATVDSKGNITGISAGTVTINIKAKATSKYDSLTKKVTLAILPARKQNSITASDISLTIGQTQNLNAKGKTSIIKYESANPEIATVDSKGNVKGISVGNTIIRITAKDTTKYFKLTKTINIQVTAVPTTTPKPTVKPTATPVPTKAPTEAPQPTKVPTQTPKPTATPVPTKVPTATPRPTATPVPLKDFNIGNPQDVTITAGNIVPFWGDNIAWQQPTYTVSDNTIISVDFNGRIKGLKAGVATVTATMDGYKPKTITITVKAAPATPTPTPTPVITQAPKLTPEEIAQEIFRLTNEERVKAGLKPFIYSQAIQRGAMVRAKELETVFSHTRPNGMDAYTAYYEAGAGHCCDENIGLGTTSPEAIVQAWMNSSGHRAAILRETNLYIGIGFYESPNGRNGWVQGFADGNPDEKVTITFDPNGGTGGGRIIVPWGQTVYMKDIPVPTKSGYTFGGWYFPSGSGPLNSAKARSNLTFCAKWT